MQVIISNQSGTLGQGLFEKVTGYKFTSEKPWFRKRKYYVRLFTGTWVWSFPIDEDQRVIVDGREINFKIEK